MVHGVRSANYYIKRKGKKRSHASLSDIDHYFYLYRSENELYMLTVYFQPNLPHRGVRVIP